MAPQHIHGAPEQEVASIVDGDRSTTALQDAAAPDRVSTVPLVAVTELNVTFRVGGHVVPAVSRVSLELHQGEILGIVGESGSGKTVTCMSLTGLSFSMRGAQFSGQICYRNEDIRQMSKRRLAEIRGAEIAMVFQDPTSSLDPLQRIWVQIAEVLKQHTRLSNAEIRQRCQQLLEWVGIPDAHERMFAYPHQLSGGMRQRVMIAIAIACNPKLLIADEPTTALDVSIQAQILQLFTRLRDEHGTAVIFVTHDLGVVADIADRVIVMYAGEVIENGTKDEIFYNAQHPYTISLLASMPSMDQQRLPRLPSIPGSPPFDGTVLDACSFAERCRWAVPACRLGHPQLEQRLLLAGKFHLDRCLLPKDAKDAIRIASRASRGIG